MAELEARIQALVPELQDQILDWTLLTGVSESLTRINRKYRPPMQMQLDRRTRILAAKFYYRNCCFRCPVGDWFTMYKWLGKINEEHVGLINHIDIVASHQWNFRDSLKVLELYGHAIVGRNMPVKPDVLEFCFNLKDADGNNTRVWLNSSQIMERMLRDES
ncbi:hypothetical protein Slin15195_G100060 [Septoria linicola]|uniref:Uncharacterized protein n=1 Tax=Septoria linicola TaxID=215465 RepID=A0A9Q9ENJ6_9PEZI|nr:hypothetical protein Slin15195_G100060 [Septoria linicola]